MTEEAGDLAELVRLEPLGSDIFRVAAGGGRGRLFGGRVLAQGLLAAAATIDAEGTEAKRVYSVQCAFVRAGEEAQEVRYEIARLFDGRSFASRTVTPHQEGGALLAMNVSFQKPGIDVNVVAATERYAPRDIPGPDGLASVRELADDLGLPPEHRPTRKLLSDPIVDIRPIPPWTLFDAAPVAPFQRVWMRARGPVGDDPHVQRALLAYQSDLLLLATEVLAHPVGWLDPGLKAASLNHSLWFHEEFDAGEWLLHEMESAWYGAPRALTMARIFDTRGRLVASAAQEGLLRPPAASATAPKARISQGRASAIA